MDNDLYSNDEKNRYVKSFLEKNLLKYGNIHYVYSVMNKSRMNSMSILSNFPDKLVDDYLDGGKQNIDPVILSALNRVTSFYWDENLKISSRWEIRSIFSPVKPYNITSGYAFVLHDHQNNLGILSLYIDNLLKKETLDLILNHKDDLQCLLLSTHEMLLDVYHNHKITKIVFTPRENEILYWCTTGKTHKEIAELLHISLGTVKFHTANIVRKMGVRNIRHAVSLATELKIVSPPAGKKIC
ncbi:hypothetical protein BTJ39_23230 [Izhakiella australiensis]|uniref:HTH luxR-type domain-containing protein n=1 Tax=Izhakiella australiensis TaxID=1926881 RepID=A0A1S8Y7A6_9GAMM|nr:LuxR family transcriptional regulator [Izhakiella australiensis]OON34727.1 hypothetical protein BTJ39_23230 [Izhakiella australiensis]